MIGSELMTPACALRFETLATPMLPARALDAVFDLKAQHWRYPPASQRRWFDENVAADDRHLLGWSAGRLVAYLRIVPALGEQGDLRLPLQVVDTVCVDLGLRGQGLGIALMRAAGAEVVEAGAVGLLACAPALAPFYAKSGWMTLQAPPRPATPLLARMLPREHACLRFDPEGRLSAAPLAVLPADSRDDARR